jgi:multicopper oxidase
MEANSAEEILRARFARGEIDTAEYKRSLEILRRSAQRENEDAGSAPARKGKLLTRRTFLGLVGLGAGALVLGGYGVLSGTNQAPMPQITPAASTNRTREYSFNAAPLDFELDGQKAATWAYNGTVPGPEIRLTEGDTLRVTVQNGLPEETTVHWHGVKVPNAMDGVPNITQPPIKSGEDFTYEFPVPTAGSYIYHSHTGLQLDRGLYGPLIIEPAQEELSYDREYTLLLDDWLDVISGTPEDALKKLQSSGGMMGGGASGGMMAPNGGGMMQGGMMASSTLAYPYYLINGRVADDPETLKVRQGEIVRLRLMNPAAETTFRFAVAGHKLTVTHADGLPVQPVRVDTLLIGMGERYDVLLEADNPGVWQVAASPEGKSGMGRALLRYEESSQSSPPAATSTPPELQGRLLTYKDLGATGLGSFSGSPDRTHALTLSGGMMEGYEWTINGQRYPNANPLPVEKGEWVRLELQNMSMMAHPMHLHGHIFQVAGSTGPYKDTALIDPMGRITFDFVADNPGDWLFHCHNVYHMESGMMRVVSYEV